MGTQIQNVKTNANYYTIKGNLINGSKLVNGKWVDNIEKETIIRPIRYIDMEKGLLKCVCGRTFIIDDELQLTEMNY